MVSVTAFFAALLALLYMALSVNVIAGRYRWKLGLGDGNEAQMTRRIRAHANFAEYVPLALILMALAEMQAAPSLLLQCMGGLLLAGRLSHAFSLLRYEVSPGKIMFRQAGMVMTLTAIGTLAGYLLI